MTTKIPAELSSTPGIADSSNATAITIDSSERVGIGVTSPEEFLQVHGGIKTTGGFLANTANSVGMSYASNYGHFISWGDNSTQGKFKFTGTAGDGSPTGDLASLDSDGLKFGSDTAAANALDDYEEGTWSPVYSSTGLSVTHDISNGYYTKIGNHVFFSMLIGTSAVSGGSGYQLTLTGLPYTSLNSAISMSSGSVGLAYKFVGNENGIKWFIGANTAYLRFYDGDSNTGAVTESNHLSTATTSNRMYIIGHYITA